MRSVHLVHTPHTLPIFLKTTHTMTNSGFKIQEIKHSTHPLPRLVYPWGKTPYCTQLKSPRLLPTAPPSCEYTPCPGCFLSEKWWTALVRQQARRCWGRHVVPAFPAKWRKVTQWVKGYVVTLFCSPIEWAWECDSALRWPAVYTCAAKWRQETTDIRVK